jgi:hypothetical protein
MLNSRLLNKASTAVTCTEIPQDGLVTSYLLQGTAEDETGTYNGTESTVTYVYDDNAGIVANFNVTNDEITSPAIDIKSISMWVKADSTATGGANTGSNYIIDARETSGTAAVAHISKTNIQFGACDLVEVNKVAVVSDETNSLLSDTWSHLYIEFTSLESVFSIGNYSSLDYGFGGQISNIHMYNRVLTTQEKSSIYNLEKYQHNNALGHGLIAYYPLDGNSLDNGLNQTDGTDTAMTYPSDADMGIVGDFNGVDGNILLPSQPINASADLVISYWFKVTTAQDLEDYFVDLDGWGGFSTITTAGEVRYRANNGTTWYSVDSVTTYIDSTWHHVVCWHDASTTTMKLYVDNVLKGSTAYTGTLSSATTTSAFGSTSASDHYFEGQIAKVRFYNRTLSEKEIDWIYDYEKPASTECKYNSTINNPDPFGDGSGVALYKMDGNVNDTTGVYDGTPTGITYADGVFGRSGVFDGSTSKIDTSFTVPDIFTLSCWFSYTATAVQGRIFNFKTVNDIHGLCKNATADTLDWTYFDGVNTVAKGVPQANYSNGLFHHAIVTSDGKFYIDNVEITAVGTAVGIGDTTFTIGTRETIDQYFAGNVEQLRVFNRVLTSEEITILYLERK